MFIEEYTEASEIKVLNCCLDSFNIVVEIKERKYQFGLLDTNISFIKQFYLDYYKNEKFIDIRNDKVMNTVFG